MGLPQWMMLGTEGADEEVPPTKEMVAQEAHLCMCRATAALVPPQLQAEPELESESLPPPVPRRQPPLFNDTQNTSEVAGGKGAFLDVITKDCFALQNACSFFTNQRIPDRQLIARVCFNLQLVCWCVSAFGAAPSYFAMQSSIPSCSVT